MKFKDLIIAPIFVAFVATCSLTFSACTSSPTAVTAKQQTAADITEDVISVGLVPVLTKNSSYIDAANTVALALGSFSGDTLTSADVEAFVAKVPGLAPEDARTVVGVINAAWARYQKRYAEQVGASIRPDVKLFLAAVSNGIHAAVAAVPKS